NMAADGLRLSSPAGAIDRPPHDRPLRGDVLVGVRAENAAIAELGGSGTGGADGVLRGRIHVVEPMGAESFVTVELEGGDRVTCRAAPDFTADFGAPVGVRVEPDRLHLFDRESQRRLD